ncbi:MULTISPECIES: GGDEF domain-containing protein [Brucella]|uniref:GGDEF domain-containing protein n=1 Tax=Brucella TaxID=234 RepID=UPI000870E925|nr:MULTISPECIES: GGDEF domain-containing protein [Brucella]MRN43499.1 diguanylate cyclase [Brucella sp. 09RB8913]MRN58944.1 diguanylate cyclase [Brucella sp. 09RB8918]CAB4327363.1 diguanylate cyclase [Brucella sp. 191011898]SCD24068.1 diguanylate cyclase [Brucella inopinata]
MKTALWKAALLTLSVVLFCVGATSITAFWSGETPRLMAISLSLGFPLVMAFPFSAFIFLRYDKLKEAYNQLEKSHVELQARARIDHMTGLLNREALFEAMKISRSRIETGTLLVIDADHFKAINDSFGHGVGDRALKLIAFALQNVTRKGDLVGRIGGEEFCVFLPGASGETGVRVAQRIRAEVENTPFHTTEYQVYPLTISIGVASAPKSETNSQVLSRADRCLYLAKQRGRNCVVFDEESAPITGASVVSINSGREAARGQA